MKKSTPGQPAGKKENGNTEPIKDKEQVPQSKDARIDQDFPGFPHSPASEEDIKKKKDLPAKVQ